MVVTSPAVRKLLLTTHVVCSVGWLGAVVASLGLSVAAMSSTDIEIVRAAYVTLELTGWFVLVPMSLASLVTGAIQSLTTSWGLFRYYWVIGKIIINVIAAAVLLMYMSTLETFADAARERQTTGALDALEKSSPVVHTIGAVLLLVAATVLSVYKPRGMTRYGYRYVRRRGAERAGRAADGSVA